MDASAIALSGISDDAKIVSVPIAAFNSTALLFVVICLSSGDFCVMSFAVGDGLIAIVNDDFSVDLLCRPDHGAARNVTVFLNEQTASLDSISNRIFIRRTRGFRFVCAMTDGVSNPVFPNEDSIPPESWKSFCTCISQALETENPIDRLQKELAFESPGYNDDRTVVALQGIMS